MTEKRTRTECRKINLFVVSRTSECEERRCSRSRVRLIVYHATEANTIFPKMWQNENHCITHHRSPLAGIHMCRREKGLQNSFNFFFFHNICALRRADRLPLARFERVEMNWMLCLNSTHKITHIQNATVSQKCTNGWKACAECIAFNDFWSRRKRTTKHQCL